jgi:hypothetical protein
VDYNAATESVQLTARRITDLPSTNMGIARIQIRELYLPTQAPNYQRPDDCAVSNHTRP